MPRLKQRQHGLVEGARAGRRRLPYADRSGDGLSEQRAGGLEIFMWSRLAVWMAALLALLWFEPKPAPLQQQGDNPLLHDLGYVTDVWARLDSAWFLRIAEHSYASDAGAAAFYPLYPSVLAVLGRLLFGHFLLAGLIVSLACGAGAFVLLHRLAEERLGADGARRTVLYLAIFPTSLFLQAVYSESLYLLLVLAAFLLAERRRWGPSGLAAGLAILTRSAGVALLPALAVLAWRAPERRSALARLTIAPISFALYPLLLWWQVNDPFRFARAQDLWHRHLSAAGPLGGVWDGLRAGYAGARQLADTSSGHVYWPIEDAEPVHAAMVNLSALLYLVLFALLTVVVWRRFGAPYGLFCTVSLALPLSVPADRWPLLSLPRFGLVIFPLFLALGALGGRPRAHVAIVCVSSILLGVTVVQWALWQWVA